MLVTLIVLCVIFILLSIYLAISNVKLKKLESEDASRLKALESKFSELSNKLLYQDEIHKAYKIQKEEQIAELKERLESESLNFRQEKLSLQKGFESEAQRQRAIYDQTLKDTKAELLLQRKEHEENLKAQFERIGASILEKKEKDLESKQTLTLDPLKQAIDRFKTELLNSTKETHEKQTELKTSLKHLIDLNKDMDDTTKALTKALKGDSKAQGDWGEMILERMLEASGLTKDREFFVQANLKDEDSNNLRPDVIIKLPDEKVVIVDSKVSLSAYASYCETQELSFLDENLVNIKNHIEGLSKKQYQNLDIYNDTLSKEKLGFKIEQSSFQYVIMFIPVEGAYIEALKKDSSLVTKAYEKKILLASGSTLMPILYIIAKIWQDAARDKNINEIIKQVNNIIAKFENFENDVRSIGTNLDKAKDHYEKALIKVSGKGSIKSSITTLKKLKTSEGLLPIKEDDASEASLDMQNNNSILV
ncbi:DNA recombination protein RmuC [Helicobacter sp. 11S02629-2]|uniref:DNA recombination protein RmuC n=1 Tax=Helicobacter sp. 11S02629-2 TaxID=1476195 RepID=UPI000BA6467F|nr:DNA recombination protein RmuC [Helicobacter sp. 11S02629-2]PAF43109.1 hypothetical protein BKH40_07275 [Helicobacter sp. 11S02629-2]